MSGRKTTSGKAERPSYDNKAVVPAASERPRYVTIRVVKAHDGLQAGEVYSKPLAVAVEMQELGYWKIVKQ